MDQGLSPLLDDLVSALPENAEAFGRRMALAQKAVLCLRPHLASGRPEAVKAQDLRAIFLALDLFVLGSRYQTVFEGDARLQWAWVVGASAEGPDAHVKRYVEPESAPDMFGEVPELSEFDEYCESGSILVELHVAPHALAPPGAPSAALLGRLLEAMLRIMALAAGVSAEDDREAGLASAARILARARGSS